MSAILRKYATGAGADVHIPIIKRAVVDFAVGADWTPATGDVKITIDGGATANIATLPVVLAMGNSALWKFVFSNAELTGKKIVVTVADSATKAVEDQCIMIETHGHASAQYVPDFTVALATPTNITAGVITTVTNLTNAPTTGDLTATMKTSVTTAATASTPVAASVTGAVGSVTGNVGGNVVGTVASVTGAVGSVVGHTPQTANHTAAIAALQATADAIPTTAMRGTDSAATAGDLASAKTVIDAIDAKTTNLPTDPADQSLVIAAADAIAALIGTPAVSVAADIATRLATAGYTAPDNASAVAAAASAATAASEATGANTKAGAIQTIFAGITTLAQWLGLIAGKQAGNSTARTEIRATGAGSGTYDETTDSTQALRDRGDAAWTTGAGGGGGGTTTIVIGPVAATVNDVAIAGSTGGVIHPLSMFKAQRATIVFVITDGNGDPIDLSADDLSFVIHNSAGTTIAEINTTNEAGQFVVGDSVAASGDNDQLTLTLATAQNDLTVGTYEFKLWNTTLAAVLASGRYQIKTAPQS